MGGPGSGKQPTPRDSGLLAALRAVLDRRDAGAAAKAERNAKKAFRDKGTR